MSSAYALSATTDSVDLDDESGYAFSDRYDIDTNSIYQYNPILDAMARYVAIYHESRSTKTLFPMLRTLKWAAFSGEPTTDYSVLFMHPDMRNFAFSYDPTGIDYHMPPTRQSLGLYFDLVLERMPSLSYLELNVNSDLLHPVLLKKIVAGLPILETVILPSFTDPELMDSSLEQLASLIYLQKDRLSGLPSPTSSIHPWSSRHHRRYLRNHYVSRYPSPSLPPLPSSQALRDTTIGISSSPRCYGVHDTP